jgi:Asp-tRNA(Asn)/Glu-tRNA(Gln) amidotransferase A subunit family amidase
MNKLYSLNATDTISLIKSNKITVEELIESTINRINEVNDNFHSFVNRNDKYNLKIAKQIDKKIEQKENVGELFGIPIGVKDTINEQTMPTEMGSKIWKGFTPGNDARVIHNIKKNFGLIIGKTDTAEFAVSSLGKALNPFDITRTPGTSSSGSATAVASFMIPLSIGTQTAGSIIRPASYCGIYGFKPSFGLIPRTGMLKTTDSLDQIGIFSRDPYDLKLLFSTMHVKGSNYPMSDKLLKNSKDRIIGREKIKIGFVKTHTWNNAREEIKELFKKFIKNIKTMNQLDVEELILPKKFELSHKMHQIIYSKSLSYYFKNELKAKKLVSKLFYDFSLESKKYDLVQYNNALQYQSDISKILDNQFKNYDFIFSLSTSDHAPLRNEKEKEDPSLIWTMCGVPTINLPVFKTSKKLPLGIQVFSKKYNDIDLLNFIIFLQQKNILPKIKLPKNLE